MLTPTAIRSEVRFREASTTRGAKDLVESVDPSAWAELEIAPRRTHGDNDWTLSVGNLVGIADVNTPYGHTTVQIEPKLPEADIFTLADWAYGASPDVIATPRAAAHLDMLRAEPTACLIAWYLHALDDFATRWMRRSATMVNETLVGRVKGSVDMTTYVRRSVSRAAPHRVPCRFTDNTRDTLPNRLLLAGLNHVRSVIPAMRTPEARRYLTHLARRIDPLLAGISTHRPSPGDFSRIRLGGSQRHYRAILAQTHLVLSNTFYSNRTGAHRQTAFLWRAHTMYEQALGNLLQTHSSWSVDASRGRLHLSTPTGEVQGGRVKPDYILRRQGSAFLLDAKWKDALPTTTGSNDDLEVPVNDRTRLRVKRPDVYQAVAYSHFAAYAPSQVGLVYPITLYAGESPPEPSAIGGFDVPVHIFFLDVGPYAASNVDSLYQQIEGAWATHDAE